VSTGTWAPTSAERAELPVVIFDGDDTLWITEPLYDGVRAEVRAIVAASYAWQLRQQGGGSPS
jgi:hypothetical protein